MTQSTRTERDSLGEIEVPIDALYGAQTERAVRNFPLSGLRMPLEFIHALTRLKKAAARTNAELGLLDQSRSRAIASACEEILAGCHDHHFPVDVFQTGSGTSSNMNVNEVIARLASRDSVQLVHPNDHVNMGQSSNDLVPTAISISASMAIHGNLIPALDELRTSIDECAARFKDVVKTGRTHLMDAMPIRFDQESGAWSSQIADARARIETSLPRMQRLAIGGTAVGSGINTHREFAQRMVADIRAQTGIAFTVSDDHFRDLACQDSSVEMSGQLNTLAVGLMKLCNDLRWMNSGPLAGLAEIELPTLQPGSSIMPGKVNPVAPEAVAMVCAQVMGNHSTISLAGQSGNFQLNVMLPVIAYNLLQAVALLANSARLLASRAMTGMQVRREKITSLLARNPVLVTALNAVIGYEAGVEIARRAWREGRAVIDVAEEMTQIPRAELERLLDAARLTRGGLPGDD